ncbi:MAG: 4-hydroxy-tetrahydrodipicolinate synthase [Clostridia bacterium]|nr:4-hydroxy-tetrahydrodipicolinate synthase [Clostridia bacterium]
MKKPVFTGSGVAIVTPFRDSGVDFAKLAELCEYHILNATDAIVVAGTTGEASTMPDDEHIATIRCVVEAVNGRIPVIAGVGSNDTGHAVRLSRLATGCGADALLHVSPYYNKTSQNGLYRHFAMIADSVDLPIILYNIPGRTGMNIDPATLQRLSRIENIVGVKECRIEQAAETAWLCGDDFAQYSGEDALVLPMLSYGGKGVISVAANIIPRIMHDMVALYLAGDTAAATRLQIEQIPLVKALFSDVNPIPVKAAMNMMGMAVGDCRLPLCEMTDAALDALRQTLGRYGLIPA